MKLSVSAARPPISSSAGRAVGSFSDEGDQRLVARIVDGESEAMDELVSRYKDRVYQLSVWQVGVEQAEDLAQEAFIEIFRSLPRFRGESRFSTWLVSVVRNVGSSYRRKLGRERARMAPVPMEVLEELPAKGQDPVSGLSRGELRRRLKRAMAQLSDEHRDTMILREWEGLSYREIANTLDIPVGTVRSRLFAARSHLARLIGRRSG